MTADAVSAADALARARAAGERAVLVTVAGSTAAPGEDAATRAGSAVVVGEDRQRRGGTLGSGALDEAAAALAAEALGGAAARRRTVTDPADPQGQVELVAEVHEPAASLVVLGTSDVARALVRLARAVPLHAALISPGGAVDVPRGTEVRADEPQRVLLAAPPGRADAVVCADPGAAWALEALRIALASDAAYVGAVAEGAEAVRLRRQLGDAGVAPALVERLRCPAGRPAEPEDDPGEVALAALAEAVEARRRATGGPAREEAGP